MDPKTAYARALSAAFASDIDQPSVAAAIQKGGLTRDQFTSIVYRDVVRGLTGVPGPALFPAVRAFARQAVDIDAIKTSQASGLSDATSSDIGGASGLVGAIAGAVGAIWSAKINTDAQKNLAQIQLQEAQITQNSQSLAAKSALIQNATANGLLATPSGALAAPVTPLSLPDAISSIGGLPTIAIGTAALATIIGAYYASKG
jgi:hypothetical protein